MFEGTRARAVGPRPIGYLLAATKLRTPQEELLTTNKAPLLETQMIGTLPWPALIFCRREGTFPGSQDLCQQERSDAARDLPGEESLVVTLALCNAHNAAHNDDRHRSSHHHRCPHCIPHRPLNFPEFDKFQSAQTCLTRG